MSNYQNNDQQKKFIAPLVIKDAKLVMKTRNFSGNNPGQYDKPGARNFSVFLDPEKTNVDALKDEGWNVKFGKPNPEDPDYVPGAFLRVHANWFPLDNPYSSMNPLVFKVINGEKIRLDEETIKSLDTDEILKANVTITGKWMNSPTYTGVVAYLKKLVVEVSGDEDMADMFDGFDVTE